MLAFPAQQKIWLYAEPVDMRKSFNGLTALARQQMKQSPVSGDYFVFINRRKTQIRILYFDRDGFCLWSKRLEQGQFNPQQKTGFCHQMTPTDLQLILEGIQVKKVRLQNNWWRVFMYWMKTIVIWNIIIRNYRKAFARCSKTSIGSRNNFLVKNLKNA
ncbi:hypothetical protein DC094_19300 [Pelagibaculum spongiae]|uniref:Transposase n=1 Tax=Pelagibaculum spongiae TaxID=2080658 RepID=A0A2V1GP30_9GAMM|nr:hypothetical protein DC094_19300 [Pelagibaculum spongiae]